MEYKKSLEMLKDEMNLHGLLMWNVGKMNTKRVFGRCNYFRKTLFLSKALVEVNSEERVLDTIRHEVAHAISPGADHGLEWKVACLKTKATMETTYTSANTVIPKSKFVGVCPVCEVDVFTANRRKNRPVFHKSCGGLRKPIEWFDTNTGKGVNW